MEAIDGLAAVETGAFRARPERDGAAIRVTLEGTADFAATEAIDALLVALHAKALEQEVAEVVIDLRQLEFMNSSCFRIFVTWLSDLQEVPVEQVYRVRLISDPSKHWQVRSLAALSCFAVDLVRVET